MEKDRKRYIKVIIISLVILFIFVLGYVIGSQSGKIQSGDDLDLMAILDKKYFELSDNFAIEGYVQIINDHTSVIGVPDSILGRQDLDKGLYERSKMLMYKNQSNGNIILLNMVANENENTEWLGSLAYQPDLYNSPDGQFESSYDEKFSDDTMVQYSFNHSNISYFITSISKALGEDGISPLNEAAKFTQALCLFIEVD